ncbi:MAG TPA: vanadium-dependent haloperoxidase, partial [Actinomycetota bacterium]|nr:vanadium-dependent haloperoxidase [Actinomycetota bacterium]
MTDTGAVAWNQAALEAVRQTGLGPPMVARALHVLHASMYDAWAAHDDLAFGSRLGDLLRRPPAGRTQGAKHEAASFAAHLALADLFPTEATAFAKLMSDLGYNPATPGPPGSPGAVGLQAARAVLTFRHGDGANQLGDLGPEPRGLAAAYEDWTGYRPANPLARLLDPNRWQPQPTPDGLGQRFLGPHWGLVVPFALEAGWELRPAGPRRHPGRSYLFQAEEVLADSAGLTDEHKAIAEYWADGPGSETPPGHWCLLAQDVSARDGHDLDQDVKLFFALTGALVDASIACWDAKRAYDSVRPISAIRFLFAGREVLAWGGPGQGTRRIQGETWRPYIATPPFGEHPSGHATFSAAAAAVLARFTGSDRFGASAIIPAGSSRVEPGITPATDVVLSWPTFTDAANQAGRSRRYGGIHFREGDLVGRALGARVGARAWETAAELFAGRPGPA